jgi:hypothetical protein
MKHAGDKALDALEPLIAQVRTLPSLVEKKRGVFYRKSKAFLHFHEDPEGLFADIRFEGEADFTRLRVSSAAERKAFIAMAKKALA